MWERLWEVLFPRTCVGCRRAGKFICDICIGKAGRVELICPVCAKRAIGGAVHPRCKTRYSLDGLVTIFRYEGVVRRAISQIKFRFKYAIAEELVAILNRFMITEHDLKLYEFLDFLTSKPTIVPVPVHWLRENWRGFNQSEIISLSLSKSLRLRSSNLLIRKRWTGQQVGKSKEKRLENIKAAFSLNSKFTQQNSEEFSGASKIPESILLVDDVWTTGATMRECAGVLKRAGVKEVWGITLAR